MQTKNPDPECLITKDIYNLMVVKEQKRITEITLEFQETIDKLKTWVRHIENKRGAWGSIIYSSVEADEIENIQNKFDDITSRMNDSYFNSVNPQ
jgi:hypothetical protein